MIRVRKSSVAPAELAQKGYGADSVQAAILADLDAKCVEDYAGPLLPYCWEELYLRSQHRLVMIGQETNGWYTLSSYCCNSI